MFVSRTVRSDVRSTWPYSGVVSKSFVFVVDFVLLHACFSVSMFSCSVFLLQSKVYEMEPTGASLIGDGVNAPRKTVNVNECASV